MSDRRRRMRLGHDAAFAEHQARREAERKATIKVTWRKVSELTGGGWSGLGPDGRIVRVVGPSGPLGFYSYYELIEGRPHLGGGCPTLARAKKAAAALFVAEVDKPSREALAPAGTPCRVRDVNSEYKGMTGGTMDTETLTAESLVAELEGFEAVNPNKAAYSRVQFMGKTVAYADTRKDGVRLDFAAAAVEKAPARFQGALVRKGGRATIRITEKNAKLGRDLLNWVAPKLFAD